jgi:cysteine synthase
MKQINETRGTDDWANSPHVADEAVLASAVDSLRQSGIRLPTLSQLANPASMPQGVRSKTLKNEAGRGNLWDVHWFNGGEAGDAGALPAAPLHLELPEALTGVKARIVVALGNRFPMIGAHKVLAAYGCLMPLLVTGRFDPRRHKAVWPSTGNYCRGGVAISRILGCHGIAVLPQGMSRERFEWLERWVLDPADIVRTPGTESNVKEIYDQCALMEAQPENAILNQFSEFGNYIVHYHCTGQAMDSVFAALKRTAPQMRLAAFVSATGSAGTIAAGDYLKQRHGACIVAVEATECPTMLCNGYGEHNIQGIGDKHIPLIHNVMNTDVVAGVSDMSSDALNLLANSEVGRGYLRTRRGLDQALIDELGSIGISGWANIVAAIKHAKHFDLGADDVVLTVATDGAAMYASERTHFEKRHYGGGFDEVHAGEIFARHLAGVADDHLLELTHTERKRIFNLGYYTWVEQQGITVEQFDSRRDQAFWQGLQASVPAWDRLVDAFNEKTGVA